MKTKAFFIYFIVILFTIFKVQAQTEGDIVTSLYSGPTDITDMSADLISYAAHGVWAASTLTSQVTTTGTLTQSSTNANDWSYSASPADKLVLKFALGATMNFQFTTISGYTDGTVDDFLDSHQMDFASEIPGKLNLHIVSNIGYNSETGNTEWNRTINGNIILESISYTANLTYTGWKKGDVGSSISIYDYSDKTTGTVSSAHVNYTIDEAYRSHSAANSGKATYAQDRFSLNNNSAQTTTANYKFSDAYCKWLSWTSQYDSAFNVVNEPYNWEASGQLLKNNATYGAIQFDRTIKDGTYGPHLIARCNNGKDYLLSTLLNPVVSGIKENIKRTSTIKLLQNYPNPFNGSTTIAYDLSTSGKAVLRVYDVTGKVVGTLVNKRQPAGSYTVHFNASQLPDGYYFYKLFVNDIVQTRKMLKLR
jgi:hypothetical protein